MEILTITETTSIPSTGVSAKCNSQQLMFLYPVVTYKILYWWVSFSSFSITSNCFWEDSSNDSWIKFRNLFNTSLMEIKNDALCSVWESENICPYLWKIPCQIDKTHKSSCSSLQRITTTVRWLHLQDRQISTDWGWHNTLNKFEVRYAVQSLHNIIFMYILNYLWFYFM